MGVPSLTVILDFGAPTFCRAEDDYQDSVLGACMHV